LELAGAELQLFVQRCADLFEHSEGGCPPVPLLGFSCASRIVADRGGAGSSKSVRRSTPSFTMSSWSSSRKDLHPGRIVLAPRNTDGEHDAGSK
jgi:hypothetical protein